MTAPTENTRFELYSYWRTSATYRVRVAFNLKGVQPHETNVNTDAGEQRSEAFLKINPMAGIPVVIDHDATGQPPLTQSLAILEFLDESYPDTAPLLPKDLHGRARVRSLAAMLAADTHPLVTPRIKKYLTGLPEGQGKFDDVAWRAWQIQWFTTGLQAVEQRLASESQTGTFCHGDTPTMADICLASVIAVMRVFKIEVPHTPTIDRIVAHCETLEAFAKAAPSRQVGAPPA